MDISNELRSQLLQFQRNEITEHHFYKWLARKIKSPENKGILEKISHQELKHYETWRKYTQVEVEPNQFRLWKYLFLARFFGFTFAIKFMELGEENTQARYRALQGVIPEAKSIAHEEEKHEAALIALLDEHRLRYVGSIVLGLNDALVELTGALAGLTLALRDTKLIALTGLITGIAAAMSMAASEYLAKKSEEADKNPLQASFYTGIAYLFTVFFLIMPYLIIDNYFVSLACTLTIAILIIGVFNYYIAITKEVSFKTRFLEMAGLSLGVAGLSFVIGIAVRHFLGVEV